MYNIYIYIYNHDTTLSFMSFNNIRYLSYSYYLLYSDILL